MCSFVSLTAGNALGAIAMFIYSSVISKLSALYGTTTMSKLCNPNIFSIAHTTIILMRELKIFTYL